mgnify:CR=1 FL=1
MNYQIIKIFIVGILMVIFNESVQSQEYRISGTIHKIKENEDERIFYVYLLTEETFKKPYTGIKEIKIEAGENQNPIAFEFKNVSKGTYGLRCFHDLNDNGKLDRFLTIPNEPWRLSWKNNEKHIPPDFEDISFEVDGHVEVNLYMDN